VSRPPLAAEFSAASTFSAALLGELAVRGADTVVLTPGSRSQSLALAAAQRARLGQGSLVVRLDERVAAFTALGMARESGRPVVIVVTSGTAVGNLLPAVMEAHHSGIPLILVTADRPSRLRGTGANQTTWQPELFGRFVRLAVDQQPPNFLPASGDDSAGAADLLASARRLAELAVSTALGSGAVAADAQPAGPVHLNLQFVEPLSGMIAASAIEASELAWPGDGESAAGSQPLYRQLLPIATLGAGLFTVVIAGDGAGPEAEELARTAGWPLLAEISSGARFGPNVIVAYRELLADADFGGRIERVIVFGHPTLSREVSALITRTDVEQIIVASGGEAVSAPAYATLVGQLELDDALIVESQGRSARAWLGHWVVASRQLRAAADPDAPAPDLSAARSADPAERRAFAKNELSALRAPITRAVLALAVWRATWPHDRLVLGASRLIREADRVVPGKKITVFSNRGLAGIDGTVSTGIGVALAGAAAERPGITRVVLGDLTLLHDVGAMLIGDGELRPALQVIVGNDSGGTIFDQLEVAASAETADFSRVLRTPHSVALSGLAAAYGWAYTRVETKAQLDQALTTTVEGPSLIEVILPE
jgi:2-succinyl-5-enolpyruvyl-6-hydroxy-3-cyclohexene-1-carboxylate synthase